MVGLTEKLLFLDFDGVITTYKSGWTVDEGLKKNTLFVQTRMAD